MSEEAVGCSFDHVVGRVRARERVTDFWKHYIESVGQKFDGGVNEFRTKLSMYVAEMGFEYTIVKNNPSQVTALCARKVQEFCCWRVHASICSSDGAFVIQTLNNLHTCTGFVHKSSGSVLNAKVISSLIEEKVRKDPGLSAKDVVKFVDDIYKFEVSYRVAYYVLEKMRKLILGDGAASFAKLARYVELLMRTNLGSHCALDIDTATRRFKRVFVSFDACIKGFRMCRPLIFVDGTFLRSKYKGTLLVAVGKDGNQGIYPLAYAVVNAETNDNWVWFMENVRVVINEDPRVISFMSDRNLGHMSAVRQTFPHNPYSFYSNHMVDNLEAKLLGPYNKGKRETTISLFRDCVKAPTKALFEVLYNKLLAIDRVRIPSFLKGTEFSNWANSYYEGEQFGDTSTNIVESFNSWIKVERHLPITELVDVVRVKIMKMFAERLEEGRKWKTLLTPRMEQKLRVAVYEGRGMTIIKASDFEYEVIDDSIPFVVDVGRRTCTCQFWHINRFPCKHAVMAYRKAGVNIYQMIDQNFWVVSYQMCYSNTIHLVVEDPYRIALRDGDDAVKPPETTRPAGRPATHRRRSRRELVRQICCSRCGKSTGHNRKTCSEVID